MVESIATSYKFPLPSSAKLIVVAPMDDVTLNVPCFIFSPTCPYGAVNIEAECHKNLFCNSMSKKSAAPAGVLLR